MSNKRAHVRRPVSYPVWVELEGGRRVECILSNASEGGAMLTLLDSYKIPRRFNLWLTKGGSIQRGCLLMWKEGRSAGIMFNRRAGIPVLLD
jgi:hypothetical protein